MARATTAAVVLAIVVLTGVIPLALGAPAAPTQRTISHVAASPPKVQLTLNPASLVLGNMSQFTGTVAQGTPWYHYDWTTLPPGCTSQNTSVLNCTPSEAGTFTITLVVTDSTGRTATNSSQLYVSTTGTTGSGGGSSPASDVYLFALAMGTLAAVATAIIFVLFMRQRRRRAPPMEFSPVPYVPPRGPGGP